MSEWQHGRVGYCVCHGSRDSSSNLGIGRIFSCFVFPRIEFKSVLAIEHYLLLFLWISKNNA
jgi:hypothetical protein